MITCKEKMLKRQIGAKEGGTTEQVCIKVYNIQRLMRQEENILFGTKVNQKNINTLTIKRHFLLKRKS